MHLLEAEIAAMQGEESEAKAHFEKAIALSKKHEFLIDEAIALERAALFYSHLHFEEHATEMLHQSYNLFKQWGASSKQYHMVKRYPAIAKALKDSSDELENNHHTYNTINAYEEEAVSVITNDLSLASVNTSFEES